jgi:hypothetical protein
LHEKLKSEFLILYVRPTLLRRVVLLIQPKDRSLFVQSRTLVTPALSLHHPDDDYLRKRFRIPAAIPTNPVPSNSMLLGSGTSLVPTTPVAGPQLSQMMSTANGD